jgi:hypothetical protein
MCDDTVVLVLCDKQYSGPTLRMELGVEYGAARLEMMGASCVACWKHSLSWRQEGALL